MVDDGRPDPTDAKSDDTPATDVARGSDERTDFTPDSGAEIGPQAGPLDSDRYAHLTLADDDVVIYDREAPESWLQSDVAVTLGA